MRITEISFCDKIGYNIRSDETKKHILDIIENKYNIKIVAKHFERFEDERSLKILNNNPHLVCLRSNGNPYLLFLTRHNFNNIAVFIDKKVQQGYFLPRMIITHVMMGKGELHQDTIFDGEMVKTKDGHWLYLMNDLLVHRGVYLHNVNLVRRMNLLYSILERDYVPNDMSPYQIAVKRYFNYDNAKEDLESYIKQLPYTCRGIYFKPLFLKFREILLNFDDTLVKKVKREKYGNNFMLEVPKVQPQIDVEETQAPCDTSLRTFFTRKTATPDVYELLDNHCKVMGIACINTMKLSKKMQEVFSEKNLVDRVELPYEFNERFKKWVPLLA